MPTVVIPTIDSITNGSPAGYSPWEINLQNKCDSSSIITTLASLSTTGLTSIAYLQLNFLTDIGSLFPSNNHILSTIDFSWKLRSITAKSTNLNFFVTPDIYSSSGDFSTILSLSTTFSPFTLSTSPDHINGANGSKSYWTGKTSLLICTTNSDSIDLLRLYTNCISLSLTFTLPPMSTLITPTPAIPSNGIFCTNSGSILLTTPGDATSYQWYSGPSTPANTAIGTNQNTYTIPNSGVASNLYYRCHKTNSDTSVDALLSPNNPVNAAGAPLAPVATHTPTSTITLSTTVPTTDNQYNFNIAVPPTNFADFTYLLCQKNSDAPTILYNSNTSTGLKYLELDYHSIYAGNNTYKVCYSTASDLTSGCISALTTASITGTLPAPGITADYPLITCNSPGVFTNITTPINQLFLNEGATVKWYKSAASGGARTFQGTGSFSGNTNTFSVERLYANSGYYTATLSYPSITGSESAFSSEIHLTFNQYQDAGPTIVPSGGEFFIGHLITASFLSGYNQNHWQIDSGGYSTNPVSVIADSHSYFCYQTALNGCRTSPDSVNLLGRTIPVITLTNSDCVITLSTPAIAGASYLWEYRLDNTHNWSNLQTADTQSAANTGDYRVTVTLSGGTDFYTTAPFNITVAPTFNLAANPSNACSSANITLTLSGTGLGSYKWNWYYRIGSTEHALTSIFSTDPNFTTPFSGSSTIFFARVKLISDTDINNTGCKSAEVTVNSLLDISPLSNITPAGPIYNCSGAVSQLLTANPASESWTNPRYQWYKVKNGVTTTVGPDISTSTYTATDYGDYYVTMWTVGADGFTNACPRNSTNTVSIVDQTALPNITATPSVQIVGGRIPQNSSVAFSTDLIYDSYQWKNNGDNISGATNQIFVSPAIWAGNYFNSDNTVTVSNTNSYTNVLSFKDSLGAAKNHGWTINELQFKQAILKTNNLKFGTGGPIFTYSSHTSNTIYLTTTPPTPWINNQRVLYTTTGTRNIAGLVNGATYFVRAFSANHFELSTTQSDVGILTIADPTGTGDITFDPYCIVVESNTADTITINVGLNSPINTFSGAISSGWFLPLENSIFDTGTGVGTSDTWTDSTKGWTPNTLIGYKLIAADNTNWTIVANTATALTVAGTPASGNYTIQKSYLITVDATKNSCTHTSLPFNLDIDAEPQLVISKAPTQIYSGVASNIITVTATHHWSPNQLVQYLNTAGPSLNGLTNGGYYYVINPFGAEFSLTDIRGGAALAITDAGGTHTFAPETNSGTDCVLLTATSGFKDYTWYRQVLPADAPQIVASSNSPFYTASQNGLYTVTGTTFYNNPVQNTTIPSSMTNYQYFPVFLYPSAPTPIITKTPGSSTLNFANYSDFYVATPPVSPPCTFFLLPFIKWEHFNGATWDTVGAGQTYPAAITGDKYRLSAYKRITSYSVYHADPQTFEAILTDLYYTLSDVKNVPGGENRQVVEQPFFPSPLSSEFIVICTDDTCPSPIEATVAFANEISYAVSTADVDIVTNTITRINHGYLDGQPLVYNPQTTPKIPELTSGATYYVVNKTADTFQLAITTAGGASPGAINFTETGNSSQTLAPLVIAHTVPTANVNTGVGTSFITITDHGFLNQRLVYNNQGGLSIAGLVSGTPYYVRDITTNTFKLEASIGSGAITFTGTGNNAQTFSSDVWNAAGSPFYEINNSAGGGGSFTTIRFGDFYTPGFYSIYHNITPVDLNRGNYLKIWIAALPGDFSILQELFLSIGPRGFCFLPFASPDCQELTVAGKWYTLPYANPGSSTIVNSLRLDAMKNSGGYVGLKLGPISIGDSTIPQQFLSYATTDKIMLTTLTTPDACNPASVLHTWNFGDGYRFNPWPIIQGNSDFPETRNSDDCNDQLLYFNQFLEPHHGTGGTDYSIIPDGSAYQTDLVGIKYFEPAGYALDANTFNKPFTALTDLKGTLAIAVVQGSNRYVLTDATAGIHAPPAPFYFEDPTYSVNLINSYAVLNERWLIGGNSSDKLYGLISNLNDAADVKTGAGFTEIPSGNYYKFYIENPNAAYSRQFIGYGSQVAGTFYSPNSNWVKDQWKGYVLTFIAAFKIYGVLSDATLDLGPAPATGLPEFNTDRWYGITAGNYCINGIATYSRTTNVITTDVAQPKPYWDYAGSPSLAGSRITISGVANPTDSIKCVVSSNDFNTVTCANTALKLIDTTADLPVNYTIDNSHPRLILQNPIRPLATIFNMVCDVNPEEYIALGAAFHYFSFDNEIFEIFNSVANTQANTYTITVKRADSMTSNDVQKYVAAYPPVKHYAGEVAFMLDWRGVRSTSDNKKMMATRVTRNNDIYYTS